MKLGQRRMTLTTLRPTYELGQLYQDFGRALMESERPPRLNQRDSRRLKRHGMKGQAINHRTVPKPQCCLRRKYPRTL